MIRSKRIVKKLIVSHANKWKIQKNLLIVERSTSLMNLNVIIVIRKGSTGLTMEKVLETCIYEAKNMWMNSKKETSWMQKHIVRDHEGDKGQIIIIINIHEKQTCSHCNYRSFGKTDMRSHMKAIHKIKITSIDKFKQRSEPNRCVNRGRDSMDIHSVEGHKVTVHDSQHLAGANAGNIHGQ